MIFTQEQIVEIKERLALLGIKDTQIRMLTSDELLDLTGDESFVIVKDGENVRISLQELFDRVAVIQASQDKDIFNVSNYVTLNDPEHYPDGRITLEDAVNNTPITLQREGQIITFENTEGKWKRYQMTAKVDNTWNSYNFEELEAPVIEGEVEQKTNLSEFNNDVPYLTADTLTEQIARVMSKYVTLEQLNTIVKQIENDDADKLYNWEYRANNTELRIFPRKVTNEGIINTDCDDEWIEH